MLYEQLASIELYGGSTANIAEVFISEEFDQGLRALGVAAAHRRAMLDGSAPFMAPPTGFTRAPLQTPPEYLIGSSSYRAELRDHNAHVVMEAWCTTMRQRFLTEPAHDSYQRLRTRPAQNKKFRKRQERMVTYLSGKNTATMVDPTPATASKLIVPTCSIIRNMAGAEGLYVDIIQSPLRRPVAASHPYDRVVETLQDFREAYDEVVAKREAGRLENLRLHETIGLLQETISKKDITISCLREEVENLAVSPRCPDPEILQDAVMNMVKTFTATLRKPDNTSD
eukprot:GHVR01079935.1.p1 GENE.GHVR01079935.1~~GHVR01079935.1.p1  ORF type:complete len:284 (+),score=27.95 GHVR01079935.1:164-1015(+)